MDSNAKKLRLNESIFPQELQFFDLNDDCIRQIFWKLPPADLCSISFTCHRMQELAFEHFPRQYPNDRVTIKINKETKTPNFFNNKETKKHLKYFAKCIRNVRIVYAGTHYCLQGLFDFVNTECSADMKTLELNIEGQLKSENVKVFKNRLENVLSLSIHHPHRRSDIYDVLLKHCKKIEYLEIRSHTDFDAFWMMHKYPTMKSLHVDMFTESLKIQFDLFVEMFFQLNPQIRNFEWWGAKPLWRYINNIKRMILHLYSWSELKISLDYLKDCNKERHFGWMELDMDPDNMTQVDYQNLENFNALQPIHSLTSFLCDVTNELTVISHLKSLVQLSLHVPYEYSQLNQLLAVLSNQLPNLQNVRLNMEPQKWLFKDVVMQFIQNSLKMRSLNFVFCVPNTFMFHPNDLVELNDTRSSISDATPMTIRLGYYDTYERPLFNFTVNAVVNLKFTTLDDLKVWNFS